MAQDDDRHAPGEITPPSPGVCEFCGVPLPETRRPGQRFCKAAHRALWHKRQKEQHLDQAMDHLTKARGK